MSQRRILQIVTQGLVVLAALAWCAAFVFYAWIGTAIGGTVVGASVTSVLGLAAAGCAIWATFKKGPVLGAGVLLGLAILLFPTCFLLLGAF